MHLYLRRFLYNSFFFFFCLQTKAQYVSIPDANFRTYLEDKFPSCMQGGMMDTTCTDIINATVIDVRSKKITDLEGAQYFDQLQTLDCRENQLTALPSLPLSLTTLYCEYNYITSLPSLPPLLDELNCETNQLTILPSLPASLTVLSCGYNKLQVLPALPNSLIYLWCPFNQLTNLPVLPLTLNSIECGSNQLTVLPILPLYLESLGCQNNKLTMLPDLPQRLKTLLCDGNQLQQIPVLPSSLNILTCSTNGVLILPALPESLTALVCDNNPLTFLPSLPQNLQHLGCNLTQITCLPVLPNTLISLITDSICRPNKPVSLKNDVPLNSAICSQLTFIHTRACVGDSSSFELKSTNCYTFMWDFDDPGTGIYNTSAASNPKHLFSHAGTYQVKLISNISNPPTVLTQSVVVDSLDTVTLGSDHSICSGDGTVLDAGTNFISYLWQDGSAAQTYDVTIPGTYTVAASNACGTISDSINLNAYTLTLPNLFTPNKDVYNEYFEIAGLNGDTGTLKVYNSWGAEVYYNKDYSNNWNGEDLSEGVYYYSFSLKTCPLQKGWVQIIR